MTDSANDKLFVNEIFGPTFQGEGLNIGRPVMFLASRWLQSSLRMVRHSLYLGLDGQERR